MNSLISSTFSEVSYNMQIHLYIYEWTMDTTLYMQLFFLSVMVFFILKKKIILIWFQSCSNWFCHSLTYFHIKIQFCSLIKFSQINYKEEKLKKKGVCENGMILYENSQLIVATFVHLLYTWFYSSNNVLITDFYPSF